MSDLRQIELPGKGKLISTFAYEIAMAVCRASKMYIDHNSVMLVTVNRELRIVDATLLRSLVEQKAVCYKTKVVKGKRIKIARRMSAEMARCVLQSPQFLREIPLATPEWWMRGDGRKIANDLLGGA